LPLFPSIDSSDTLWEIFCGGLNVGINHPTKVVAVDTCPQLIELYRHWQEHSISSTIMQVESGVREFALSKTNAEGYYRLRESYNQNPNPLYLYLLICHSFNHQIRFNSQGGFNMPFGKDRSQFNKSLKTNLIRFLEELHAKEIECVCADFENIEPRLQEGDLVYCDPPYSITLAAYNERNQWLPQDDLRLFAFLDRLDEKKIKFALSNVMEHEGKTNMELAQWAEKYNVHHLMMNYENCSYHKKVRSSSTEVCITNY
jgi:DNA adenine methylase Dam